MQIGFEARGDVLVLRLSGRFTAGSEEEYQRTKERIQSAAERKVLLDFQEVPYIDSTGLAYLVGLYHAVRARRGRIVLARAIPRVCEVLTLTRLNRVFPNYATEEEALSALAEWEKMKRAAAAS